MVWFGLVIALHPQTPKHIRVIRAAGHIILTPANQLMVMGLKIWSLSNPGIEPATFRSLAHELTNCSNWAPTVSKADINVACLATVTTHHSVIFHTRGSSTMRLNSGGTTTTQVPKSVVTTVG
jgi:hypothetical protein